MMIQNDSERHEVSWDDEAIEKLRSRLASSATHCRDCRAELCGHEKLYSIALGLQDRPLCLPCLAGHLGRSADEVERQLGDHFRQRSCYRTLWAEETDRDPDCSRVGRLDLTEPASAPAAVGTASTDESLRADDEWDAGDMACGDLVLALRLRLRGMEPGATLLLRATDSGAPEDIPAWCRLTGNTLLRAQHPHYLLRRKD